MDFYCFLGAIAATIFTLFGTIFYMVYGKLRVQENKTIASSSSPSSPQSSLSHNRKHHVFPSFHGVDVRRSFLSHILKEFRSKGINPFIDNEIKRGEFIGPELKRAIQESKIAIVLLSKNYASLSWCLDELVEIMKCKEDLGQTVITIFYEVDPSDVKKQAGDFGKVFIKTCKGKTNEVIGKWRQALAKVATLAGYHSNNWDDEAAMIENIATYISNMLNVATPSSDFDSLIGMGAHIRKMESLLHLDLDEVRMVGIWGPSGIGKTTIARFLYNQVSKNFQLSAIMVNIRRCYPRPCLDEYNAQLQLQSQMLSQMNNQKDIVISHLGVAQERLKDKKVFLILDDVDRLGQLVALAKESRWFGPGSRIIITTEDLRVLKAHGIKHIYKVAFPSSDEALQIFFMYAFGKQSPKDGFTELAHEVTYLAGELPLGLKVMGSYFKGMPKQEWKNALPSLRSRLDREIESILQFSYDALYDEEKDLFLHIACFFNYGKIEKVVEHLSKRFSDVRQRLNVLAEKSLVSMDGFYITMHNLLVKLGEEIVRKQSIREPGQRQFLVGRKEICEILIDDAAGSRNVIGINFRFNEGELNISERAFEEMSNLQFLRLNLFSYNTLHLSHGLSYISPKLRLLDWKHFPMTCLPSNINVELLVELNMTESKLAKLWEGIKSLRNLKWMDLSFSVNLKELPNLSTATRLEILNLKGCSSLGKLPSTIGNATNLQKLNLRGCSSLRKLPSTLGNATNLQKLNLRGCSSLGKLPSTIGNATKLENFDLSKCSSLVEIPSSIGNATNLRNLDLSGCLSLEKLPSTIGNAKNLRSLNLSGCSSLEKLPSTIGNATNLQSLDLKGCSSLVEISSSIGKVTNLKNLDLSGCSSLVELHSSIGNATNLLILDISGCSSLRKLPFTIGNAITNLKSLNLSYCSSLVELPLSIVTANLQNLNLSYCSSLVELPSSIGTANLQKLNLSYCSSVVELPSSIGTANLQELNLSYCSNLVELPSSIGNATDLQDLDLRNCLSLVELPSSIGNATNLKKLVLRKCSSLIELPSSIWNAIMNQDDLDFNGCSNLAEIPSSIGNAVNLKKLNFNGCSSLMELSVSIGNLHKLESLILNRCSKLEVLPVNVNLKSLRRLDLSDCLSLKSFPEISTNISYLNLSGTAIEEVSSLISSWPRLETLDMSYCKNLKEFPHALDNIIELHLSYTKIQEIPPLVQGFSRLRRLTLEGCKELLSLSQLPNSLLHLDAESCESLERLNCSFQNPEISLNFANCFKLNKEARDLIIQTSTQEVTVLPGGEMPTYFTYRANGCSLIVKLNERPFPSSLIFKACIVLVSKNETEAVYGEMMSVDCGIMDKQNSLKVPCSPSFHVLFRPSTEHLYIFEFEANVTSNELFFELRVTNDKWGIKECGLHFTGPSADTSSNSEASCSKSKVIEAIHEHGEENMEQSDFTCIQSELPDLFWEEIKITHLGNNNLF